MARKKKKQEVNRFKYVVCSALNVRQEPSTSALIVKTIPQNYVIEYDTNFVNDDWDHIFIDGTVGFCMKKFLEPASSEMIEKYNKNTIAVHSWHQTYCDGQNELNEEVKDGKEN